MSAWLKRAAIASLVGAVATALIGLSHWFTLALIIAFWTFAFISTRYHDV